MDNETALKMEGVTKDFPGVRALDGVDLEVKKGEVHVLLGENGAGKSTLVKIISGAHQKTTGKISLFGRPVEINSPHHAQELGVSIIYQEFNLIPHLTAAENIFLGREPELSPGVIDRKKISASSVEILKGLEVDIDPEAKIKNLGVAEQQMVEVAKALSLNAKIMIMDEPTSALTEQEIKELFSIIRKLKAKGVAIIYISHRLEELFEIGDRVTILRDGKYIETRSIKEISQQELIRMMVGRELKEQFPVRDAEIGGEVLRVEKLNRPPSLRNISFSLHKGEILGIAGLLGSGRTELARALFGVDRTDSGAIYLDGRPVEIDSPRKAINLGMGFLTEDRKSEGLVLNLPVKENMSLPSVEKLSSFGVIDLKQERGLVEHYVKELRVKTPSLRQKVVYLSGGNQQKIVLTKWLCTQAKIFIFDEPTRGIDVGAKAEIYALMNKLAGQGVAIMMISSELPEILGMSDRVLVMHKGSVAAEFGRAEATQEKIQHAALG